MYVFMEVILYIRNLYLKVLRQRDIGRKRIKFYYGNKNINFDDIQI